MPAPTTDETIRPAKARSMGGSCVRSYSEARKLPGTSATRLVAVAVTGLSPVAIRAGKVTTAAPPTSAEIVPPAMPAGMSSAIVWRSIVFPSSTHSVMPGLVPASTTLPASKVEDVGSRDKPGHDEENQSGFTACGSTSSPGRHEFKRARHVGQVGKARKPHLHHDIEHAVANPVRPRCLHGRPRQAADALDLAAFQRQCQPGAGIVAGDHLEARADERVEHA